MWTNNSIELKGRKGRKINNKYYKQESGSNTLTVIIAGFAYTIESPTTDEEIKKIKINTNIEIMKIENADHGLEISDVKESIYIS